MINDPNEASNVGSFEILQRALSSEYEMTPEPLRKILMFNLSEQSLSQKYYREMFYRSIYVFTYIDSLDTRPPICGSNRGSYKSI